jgi:hypothetical protein
MARDVLIPTKSQVLQYFTNAQSFRILKINSDIQVSACVSVRASVRAQITDADGNPLFDVWVEMDCCRCTWIIEAYGKVRAVRRLLVHPYSDCDDDARKAGQSVLRPATPTDHAVRLERRYLWLFGAR